MSTRKVASLAVLVALLPGCGGPSSRDAESTPDGASETRESAVRGEVLVSAAASLTDAFGEIATDFEAAHPGVEVALNLAGSSTLRAQILEGAPADLFASADLANMERVAAAGGLGAEPRVFAGNLLQIAVPPGNPAGVRGLADFAREGLVLGLCAATVPCGELARRALARAGVVPVIDTDEPDVRALLTKIELGELDAGITYVTDVSSAAGAVEGIDIPAEDNVGAEYAVATLAGAPNPEAARAFMSFVLSPDGGAILARHGFQVP